MTVNAQRPDHGIGGDPVTVVAANLVPNTVTSGRCLPRHGEQPEFELGLPDGHQSALAALSRG